MMIDPEDPPSRQADRASVERAMPAANKFSDFIRFQEDGQLDEELSEALKQLSQDMAAYAINAGGKAAGKLSLQIGFSLDGKVFTIAAKFKTDVPEPKRQKSVMWMTEDGRFTPSNPAQREMFSVREVRGAAGVRDA